MFAAEYLNIMIEDVSSADIINGTLTELRIPALNARDRKELFMT